MIRAFKSFAPFTLIIAICAGNYEKSYALPENSQPSQQVAANFLPTEQGIALFVRRVDQNPQDFISLNLLSGLYLRHAQESGDTSLYLRAKEVAEKALALKSDYSPAIMSRAAAMQSLHFFEETRDLVEPMLKVDSFRVAALAITGDTSLELGEIEIAERHYAELKKLSPDDPSILARNARISELRGDDPKALKLLAKAESIILREGDFQRELVWYRLRQGEISFRHGDFKKAESLYRKALKAWPESYRAKEHLAEVTAASGNTEAAVSQYQELLKDYDYPELHQALGELYLFIGKATDALPHLKKASDAYLQSINAGQIHYLHHISGLYADSENNPTLAVKYAQADFNHRKSIYSYDQLAWALYKSGDFTEARKMSDKALVLGTKDPHLLYHASMINSAAGDAARGSALLKQVVSINPKYNSFHIHR